MTTVDLTDMELTTTAPIEIIHQGIVVVPLSAEEARQIVKNINGRMDQCRKDLLELYDREGWRALGYESWGACARAEFGGSVGTLYRQLEAAMIERDVLADSQVENPAPIPTTQLQAAKHLSPADRPKAFKRADELAGTGPRTTRHIQQAAAEIARPDLPIEFAIVKRRFESLEHVLSEAWDGHTQRFVVRKDGGTGVVMLWPDVLTKLEKLEAEPKDAPASESMPKPSSAAVTTWQTDERADSAILTDVTRILDQARILLASVKVSQWRAAPIDAAVVTEQARAFALTQRDRLTRFSQSAMVSQITFKQALDHIEALVGPIPQPE